mmetsp:Transcript_53792/g.114279  ORF Transcript_53792/g.114279 Transcript_53792/m.114279 type:complete len:492 (-) Transcript_53792:27-1502(-)|eukprot:CAMPEP_0172543324 /NCGR_PEP_ID=MMETSP1067-20121228/13748_1 /TAXON_ID=265564 ORGANISM="Thalassiosira punctigera, Strain Tpunct2005C2" /NCGR_SAMPLE_ID=MMETSP1067 /ASSEMBLY_ACC=CAM_ASM_000444 /LENGTH=491 /DNA_ID=CAMNT_0013329727 /DNA_START=87 /DNA_END=1559 /DNA_ORIENTATION=-
MFKDVDLDATSTVLGDEEGGVEPGTASQHPPSSRSGQAPIQSAQPARHASRRITMRGKTSYHFSVKRPRRNVVKRSIATLPRLENIEEEKETLLGIDMTQKRDSGHHPLRAPRVALALFLLVCSAGGYRRFDEYWTSRNAAAETVAKIQAGDITQSFEGSDDGDHRETLMLTAYGYDNFTEAAHNIEDAPTILFDETVVAPEELSHLVNVFREQYNPTQNKLFLWHIPRSGTTTIKRIASYCMGLTLASEAGKSEVSRGPSQELQIVEGLDGMHFASVDLSNPEGIELAKVLNVGQSERVDLVSSPYLWDSAGLFDEVHKGYMVAMFRHPIERAVSLYYSMRKKTQYEKQVGSLTSIEQYAKSSLVENNWMTRFLSNTLSGELTPQHEAIAKEVLRTKCLVGLLREKTETMRRLEVLFNLKAKESSKRREECQEKLLYWDWPGKNRHEPVTGGEAWDILYKHNTFDLRLYEYAEQLFEAQGKLFQNTPSAW